MNNARPSVLSWDKSHRALFLTKDLRLIEEQLYNGLTLAMSDLHESDLLDDINTDIMTPAWVCFHYDPKEIAKRAYAGLLRNGKRIFDDGALINGNFRAIVSGARKGVGSSRETAAQCERYSGIRLIFACSFAPIHRRNNINLGQIMGSPDLIGGYKAAKKSRFTKFLPLLTIFPDVLFQWVGFFRF